MKQLSDHIISSTDTIRALVDSFLDGGTTIGEERMLYDYFSSDRVDPSLAEYRDMFVWYASLATMDSPEVADAEPAPVAGPFRILPLRRWQWVAVAASLALLFTAGYFMRPTIGTGVEDMSADYANSYMISNGERTTDLSVIIPEAERLEAELERRIMSSINRRIVTVDGRVNATFSAESDMSDAMVNAIFDDTFN